MYSKNTRRYRPVSVYMSANVRMAHDRALLQETAYVFIEYAHAFIEKSLVIGMILLVLGVAR